MNINTLSKNVLITGVSKGLGIEICKLFLINNWCVYGVSRSFNDNLEKIKNQFQSSFFWYSFDLENCEFVHNKIFRDFISNNIAIHAYINNAAIAYDDIITNLQYEQLLKMYKINVFTPMIITKYIIRNFLLHDIPGSIVHISSISVHTGYKGLAMYASTKGALEAFSKNTAREWGVRKIRSNCIVAGFMDTDMSSSLSEEQKNRIYQRTSLKMPTDIHSVAQMALYLCSPPANSITGQNIFVDSGTI